MQLMKKKGDLEFDVVLKILLALVILLIILGLIFIFKGKAVNILEKIKDVFRFGA
ncbi:hypothetical protein HYU23_03590 [Candidatus Woesearchaeota archaeon]|nr:hypothetical protein [Candidatus Woesearchaeota archaeon]